MRIFNLFLGVFNLSAVIVLLWFMNYSQPGDFWSFPFGIGGGVTFIFWFLNLMSGILNLAAAFLPRKGVREES